MRTLLVDADAIAMRHACGSADPRESAFRFVEQLYSDLGGNRLFLCFSCPREECFRREFFRGYKAGRKGSKPDCLPAVIDALRLGFDSRDAANLEADDLLGILATQPGTADERIMVSGDSDLRTVPGLHYDPWHRERGIVTVTERQADYNHMRLCLCGKSGDFPGCPKVGPVGVRKVLGDPESSDPTRWWPRTVAAFRAKGLTEADALTMARVSRTLRHSDFDFEARRPIPWSPALPEPAGV